MRATAPTSTASRDTGCPDFTLPFGGTTVAGTILLTAGIVGFVINATLPTVKTSR